MKEHLVSFLNEHWDLKSRFLLALSGGPDSMALLYLLLEVKEELGIDLHLVHIDHGWREESAKEAAILQKLALELNLPFHLKSCRREDFCGNLEEGGRRVRLGFYQDILKLVNAQAVLLAHHLNDATEGVFKRFFESTPFYAFSGLKPVSVVEGMTLWRPLLDVSKEQLKDFLRARQIAYFEDATNLDPRFLRGRIRSSFLPQLSREFGKNIEPALQTHRLEAEALSDYLDLRLEPQFLRIQRGPFGDYLDLSRYQYRERYELKALIDRWFSKEKMTCSKRDREELTAAILQKKGGVRKVFKELTVIQDRGRLFLLRQEPPPFGPPLPLKEGVFDFHSWKCQVTKMAGPDKASSWIDIWQGRGFMTLATDQLSIGYPSLLGKLDKKWTSSKVPAFLRVYAPVLFEGGEPVHEFLTGAQKKRQAVSSYLIQLEYQGASLLK